MTYNPNIPAASDLISASQSDIQTNFNQANSIFNADHYAFNDATSAKRGLHRLISFPAAQVADPALGSNVGYFYLKNDPNDSQSRPQPYYKNNTAVYKMNSRFQSAATNGYCQIPGIGLIVMWGFFPTPSSTTQTVTFPTISNYTGGGYTSGFPNNCFNVITTVSADDTTEKTVSVKSTVTTTQFVAKLSTTAMNGFYWVAIGN